MNEIGSGRKGWEMPPANLTVATCRTDNRLSIMVDSLAVMATPLENGGDGSGLLWRDQGLCLEQGICPFQI
ncbi:MAG TPA: hypothetical protein VFP60_06825 [Pseudolabrys sp.]|nr:hypothetical protein [Pseudolabrys sp.]